MFGKSRRVGAPCAVVALALFTALVLPGGAAPSVGRGSSPPGGVFTCEWIAAHPAAAAAARVTCDPATFFAATATAISAPATPLSQGCASVPSSGNVGQGVFAWSSYEYSTFWGWYAFNSPADYTWYV